LITEQVEVKQTQQNSWTSIGTYKLTAYCPCSKCCGKWAGGNTSSGTVPTQGRTVACNTLAAGTRVNINGNDYIVEDTGNMKGNVIDIFFNSHQEA
jgi:3D (Asp-Asp-Asp) domain-containing protein